MLFRSVSPAGKIEKEVVFKAVETLTSLGYNVEIAENALSEYGRFSGTDEERCSDINDAIRDESVKAILCSRGGYGVARIIDKIDIDALQRTPKWIIGYSDITALHSLVQQNGILSIHAQMCKLTGELPETEPIRALFDLLKGEYKRVTCYKNHKFNRMGVAEGNLIGGNLAVISGLRATPYDFNYQNSILFIEDIGETPYKIDRIIQNLRLSGVLSEIKALIVGQFTDCGDQYSKEDIYSNISSIMSEYNIPICFDFPVGHVDYNMPMVEGCKARLLINDIDATLTFMY